jgi:hypothetical protein
MKHVSNKKSLYMCMLQMWIQILKLALLFIGRKNVVVLFFVGVRGYL